MNFVLPLTDEAAREPMLAGGKAANLGKLAARGYRVPPSLIVTAPTFVEFARHNNLVVTCTAILNSLNIEDRAEIEKASLRIRRLILSGEIPDTVQKEISRALESFQSKGLFAVRSSAVVEDGRVQSWAGQFDSYLNISREDIFTALKECWASTFSVRTILYGGKRLTEVFSAGFGVILQGMIASDKSGVSFSQDPTGRARETLLVEAVQGLGDRLVSGRVTPSCFYVDRQTGVATRGITDDEHGSPVLTPGEIGEIATQTLAIERDFGVPVDVEWSYEGLSLFILQARPITTNLDNPRLLRKSTLPQPEEYELTFKVVGLTFLFTDMLAEGFRDLHPLFISDEQNRFWQYFPLERMAYASRSGIRRFSKPESMAQFADRFTAYYEKNRTWLDHALARQELSKSIVARSFRIMSRIMAFYSRTDNEFTDSAVERARHDPVIGANLLHLSKFKDVARRWVNDLLINEGCHFERLCRNVAQQFALDVDVLQTYSVRELCDLFDGRFLGAIESTERRHAFCIYFQGGKMRYLSGDEALALARQFGEKTSDGGDGVVRGRVANEAAEIIEGTATVITVDYGHLDRMSKVIDDMPNGNILIADFTAPELIEACRKARGIVTDIGGLLSHAAIVSREFGIPCIVGTGKATKVFRTGDRVRLDTHTGTVIRLGN
jgi:phosphohistidine swiveling domain-containing protein